MWHPGKSAEFILLSSSDTCHSLTRESDWHHRFSRRSQVIGVLDLEMTHKKIRETQAEHTMWLEDIGRWRGEHRRAAAKLAQVQSNLMEHEAALESHAETVRAHELHIVRLERAIADEDRGLADADHEELANSHEGLQAKHDQARDAHERIKEYHDVVAAEIARLLDKLHAAM